MTLTTTCSLIVAMTLLAITPDTSVIAVVARSIYSGFQQSLITIGGILFGDFIFILLAIGGLTTVMNTMESFFLLVKYFGGGYLIYLGVLMCKSKPQMIEVEAVRESSVLNSFTSGLLITISDPKAILFYVSFLPAFLDLHHISTRDILLIMLSATIAVGGVKLVYAYTADKAKKILCQKPDINKLINLIAGIAMITVGIIQLTI